MADAITAQTEWPTQASISGAVKDLINHFFTVVNDKSDNGRRLQEEVFGANGTWTSPGRAYTGAEFVVARPSDPWKGIVSRVHQVQKVYSCDDKGDDLMLFGRAVYTLDNGAVVDTAFAARCVVDHVDSEHPHLKSFHGYTDKAAMDVQESDEKRATFLK